MTLAARVEAARDDVGVAAECLLAFRASGDIDDDDVVVGAVLIAEFLALARKAIERLAKG